MDKILQAMAKADKDEDSKDPGASLLAMIRKSGHARTGPSAIPPSHAHTGSHGHNVRHSPLSGAGGESKIRYDRDFLFNCAESPLCKEIPNALLPKLDQFPQMRRKNRPFNHTHASSDHYRFFEHQPSIVDSLPLRPTAQIFTWDPNMGQWVPRARPQEV